jgi:preprotein translocase subunit SecA
MRHFWKSLFDPSRRYTSAVERIHAMRKDFSRLNETELRAASGRAKDLLPLIAVTAVVASRLLGQDMFDVQLRAALALTRGRIAEMQTGEGKTLAAVPAIAWFARQGEGVHVLTVNDYLARRDASWMGEIYRWLGLSVAHLEQGMPPEQRRAAYAADITYATANEIGFDFLRDRLALHLDQQVQRPFAAAVIDEADSILIDEARVPLVIAGGDSEDEGLGEAADQTVRALQLGWHYTVDIGANNVALTDAGIAQVERVMGCGNMYETRNLSRLTAAQDALHAHALLRRDVDYVVKNGAVEMVDEFKGRIALDRRWPAGLHTAVEVKEDVATKRQGQVLASITLQNLVAMYPQVCGMTGTASTQADELMSVYGLEVEVIPPNKPVIRIDHPDEVFRSKAQKEQAVLSEIRRAHSTGQPVLVGTGSVGESERLSRMLTDIPHRVLNARQDEEEASTIALAGERGSVTISTNMAGRGTDIRLGEGAAAAGGLYVIGMQKHDSRRIDNQLRGRSGRQGDPGCSRFYVSDEDDLMLKYRDLNPRLGTDPDTVQRLVEGRHLDARLFLQKYELPVEGQRHRIHMFRQQILEGRTRYDPPREMLVAVRTIDDLWSAYLAELAEFRSMLPWIDWAAPSTPYASMGRRDAYQEYAQKIHAGFQQLEAAIPVEIERRIEEAAADGAIDPGERGAVWTYITTEQPFGSWGDRLSRGLRRARG